MKPRLRASGPLAGRRILITRARGAASVFADLLRKKGAEVVEVPTIRFEPPDSWEAADRAIARLDRYALIIFTSANGVGSFFRRLGERGGTPSGMKRAGIAAIGEKTAEALGRRGVEVHIVPESFRAEGIVAALDGEQLAGKEILIPRAQEARDLLVLELEKRGARVTVAPVYRTVRAEESREPLLRVLQAGGVDLVTFTAASTVNHFVELLGAERVSHLMKGIRIACIGPITAETARSRGLAPDLLPERFTLPDLASAIVRYFSEGPGASR